MRSHTMWTEEMVARLKALRATGKTVKEIAAELGLGYDATDHAVRRYSQASHPRPYRVPENLHVDDVKEMPSVEMLLQYVLEGQELIRDFDPRQREVFPEFETDRWIGIVFQGDWHFEHYKTDLQELVKDLELIGGAENVFYVFNGDIGDWADVRFKGFSLPSVIIPIELRYQLIHLLVSKIPNLLAVVAGCHDDWVRNRAAFDIIANLKEKRNALGLPTYYLGYGGFINFQVGKVQYRIATYHKYGFESQFNIFHPCIKLLQLQDSRSDVVCVSHRHDKMGISYQFFQNRPVVLIRSGSHQYLTDYAWKEGFAGAIARAPMLLLNGTTKQMRAYANYKDGLTDLRILNSQEPEVVEVKEEEVGNEPKVVED
jgi:hypothetical protein